MSESTAATELLDWTSASIHNEFAADSVLVVEGETPVPMRVDLYPQPVGVVAYEYWPVEVRGRRAAATTEVRTPFKLTRETKNIPHGTVGFELIGATMREYFPPKEN